MAKSKTLVLFYPGCIEYEIMLAAELLSKTSSIDVATPDGSNHEGSNGMTFRASHRFANAMIENYRCILIPGGDVESVINNEALGDLLADGAKSGTVLAAIGSGPLFLAKAGVLKGKRFTHGIAEHFRPFLAPFCVGAEFCDEPLVIDGDIFTAKPEAHIDFAIAVAERLGAIPNPARAEVLRKHYKGLPA